MTDHAGISLPTVQKMEAAEGVPAASGKNLAAVQKSLESAGVIFIAENGEGPGVRLRKEASAVP